MSGQAPAQASASKVLGAHVARLRHITLASGRKVFTGYDDLGRQIIAVPSVEDPEVVDVYMRETTTSAAVREERIARKARRRSLRAIKAGIRNISVDEGAVSARRAQSHRAQSEDRAREVLSRLSPIPAGGDDLGDF